MVAITLVPSYVRGRSIITCARRILTWPAQGAALVHDSSWVRPMPIMRANCSWYLSVGSRLSVVHSDVNRVLRDRSRNFTPRKYFPIVCETYQRTMSWDGYFDIRE